MTPQWQRTGQDLLIRYLNHPRDDVTLKLMEEKFKEHHPGNYSLSWAGGAFRIDFSSDEEGLLWIIKNA